MLTWRHFEIDFYLLFNNSSWLGWLMISSFSWRHSKYFLVIFEYPGADLTIDPFKDGVSLYLSFTSAHFSRGWSYSPFFCFRTMSCDYSIAFWTFLQLFLGIFFWIKGGWHNVFVYNITCLAATIKWAVVLVSTVALVF